MMITCKTSSQHEAATELAEYQSTSDLSLMFPVSKLLTFIDTKNQKRETLH